MKTFMFKGDRYRKTGRILTANLLMYLTDPDHVENISGQSNLNVIGVHEDEQGNRLVLHGETPATLKMFYWDGCIWSKVVPLSLR